MRAVLIIILASGYFNLQAQEAALGYWNLVDEKTGRRKNTIQLYKKGDEYFGKIVDTNPKPGTDPNPLCTDCEGERKNKHVIGMDIITGLQYNERSDQFEDGKILNPKNGNEYVCKVWLGDDEKLYVRGYKFFFHKTYTLLPSQKEF